MNSWVRLYHDTPSDPKWRTIARKSGQRIGDVLAVWMFVLTNASANGNERGRTNNLDSEDIATALDLKTDDVDAILSAMEGKVIESGKLTGWEKRNPINDDGGAERARAWRERKRTEANGSERSETEKNVDKIREDKIREEKKYITRSRARKKTIPLPDDWKPNEDHVRSAAHLNVDWRDVEQRFRDYLASTGKQYVDYDAAFRNFIKNAPKFNGVKNGKSELMRAADRVIAGIDSWAHEVGGGEGETVAVLLPQRGRERPGNLHDGDNGDPFGIRGGSDYSGDGPEDGASEDEQVFAESGGSRGSLRFGGENDQGGKGFSR